MPLHVYHFHAFAQVASRPGELKHWDGLFELNGPINYEGLTNIRKAAAEQMGPGFGRVTITSLSFLHTTPAT